MRIWENLPGAAIIRVSWLISSVKFAQNTQSADLFTNISFGFHVSLATVRPVVTFQGLFHERTYFLRAKLLARGYSSICHSSS